MIVSTFPIQIVYPVAGTMCWSEAGEALGVWGVDVPIRPKALLNTGAVRDLSEKEAFAFRKAGKGGTP
ncbi:hypothetical protein [Gymnodinialimonas ulvae]|uniref:hypothetical protein n=1 Tax=Gymnodinialimonas ulvae TaxID=3126504 RepID=UPI0030A5016F